MSANSTGGNECDRCGHDVGNGGIDKAVVVSDFTATGAIVNLHFCRENGCAGKVLSKANLASRLQREDVAMGVATPGAPQPDPDDPSVPHPPAPSTAAKKANK